MTQKYQFVAAHASEYPLTVLCRLLGLARSGYYAWRKRPLSARMQQDKQLTADIQRIFTNSRQTYGSPRVHAQLRKARPCRRKLLARLMRQAKLVARPRRRTVRTTDSRHAQPIAPNLLGRAFDAPAPNRIWVADITYLATQEGWFLIYELSTSRPIGTTNFSQMVRLYQTAEFNISIGAKDCWGQGYGTETARLMLCYAFGTLGFTMIWLRVLSTNERGIRAYLRAGFQEAGRLREAQRIGQEAIDVVYMDCLAREFLDCELQPA